jgi:two-component system CheB/CheR fusion protein
VQILRRSPGDAAVTAKARDLIDRQVQNMSRLVTDLLDAARAENGQIKLQQKPLDLRSVIARVVDLLLPAFEVKHQSLRSGLPETPVWVDGDATRLEQVLINLLNNANKFTQQGGDIQINLATILMSDGKPFALVEVKDNGEGISSELIPSLFALFTQADRSLAHSQGGLGIGLSLVRTLIEMHGGRVTIRSAGPGKGSTVEARIPLCEPPAEEVSNYVNAIGPPVPATQVRVLLVEDNSDIRESSCELLSMAGFEVKAVANGDEALAMAPIFAPTAILVDVGLPDISGYEVARRLRENPLFAGTLLVAVTGYGTPEARALSAAAGFDHHVCKPVNFEELTILLSSPKH